MVAAPEGDIARLWAIMEILGSCITKNCEMYRLRSQRCRNGRSEYFQRQTVTRNGIRGDTMYPRMAGQFQVIEDNAKRIKCRRRTNP